MFEQFHSEVSSARTRLDALRGRIKAGGAGPLLQEALQELLTAFEELQVGEEELRQQNEALAAAQLMLETEHARYADLFHFAPDPYLVTTLDGAIREANRAAAELLGVAPRALAAKPVAVFVAPDERRAFREQVNRAARGERVSGYEVELRGRGDAPVRVACTVQRTSAAGGDELRWQLRDITESVRAAERERALAAELAARAEAEAVSERISAVLEGTTDGFVAVDAEWRLTWVNRRAEALVGRPRGELLRHLLWDCFPAVAAPEARAALERAMADRHAVEVELSPVPGRWTELHAHPTGGGLSLYFRDVTASRQRAAGDRLLTRAGEILAGALDTAAIPQQLAELATGELADWCVVHLGDEHEVRAAGIAHADPARQEALRALFRDYPRPTPPEHPVVRALQSGEPQLLPVVGDELLRQLVPDPAQRAAARSLGAATAMVVPMLARGRTLGAISCARGHGAAYGAGELALAAELARRAALALDNARLYEEARAATRAREDVLAVVSHDLRNPLNAVLLAAIILDEYSDADRWNERERLQLRTIRHSAEQMATLIHDLVEMVSLESGTRVLRTERLEPAVVAQAALEMYAAAAAERGVALELVVPPELPALEADRARLLQLLANLLGNAVKFTPQGGSVTLAVEPDGEQLRFTVRDTGPGIDPAHLPRLFERFWQAERSSGEGLGLGLAIARAIADAHGGRIWAESTPGAGAAFHVTLRPA